MERAVPVSEVTENGVRLLADLVGKGTVNSGRRHACGCPLGLPSHGVIQLQWDLAGLSSNPF